MKHALVYFQRLFESCKTSQSLEEKSWTSRRESTSSSKAHLHELCRRFSLAEIKAATNNFHEDLKIGQEFFRFLYKGYIDNGTVAVSVKRLWSPRSSVQAMLTIEFKNEMRFLCQLRHPNVVTLIGFCDEGNEKIAVYEYTRKLTLAHHLYGASSLSWEQRLKICIEVSRALHYLHAGVKYAIIHGHVNSSNILLDENWTSKITDFGLSRLGPHSMSKSLIEVDSSTIVGPIGYIDPNFLATSQLTEKSDVYSFGVLLLEVLSSRRVHEIRREEDQQSLIQYARKCIEIGSINAIIDTNFQGRIAPECLQKFVEIAVDCICMERRDRPSMGEVQVNLELALELQEKAQLH